MWVLKFSSEFRTEYKNSEADRLNKSNRKIGEMRAPNISREKGLFLWRIVLDAVHKLFNFDVTQWNESCFLFEAQGAGATFVQRAHREIPGIPPALSIPAKIQFKFHDFIDFQVKFTRYFIIIVNASTHMRIRQFKNSLH